MTQAANALTANERFVQLVYFNFLGRVPAPPEVAFQVNALHTGTSRADLVMNFFNAEEFNQGGRFIAGLYLGILARDAEFGGWLFQRNALATRLVSQIELVRNFIQSEEFQLRYGAATDDQLVTLLYQNILGRQPSPQDRSFQVAAVSTYGRGNRQRLPQQRGVPAQARRAHGRVSSIRDSPTARRIAC